MRYDKIPFIHYVPIIIISLLLYRVVNNIEHVGGMISKSFSLLSYFIWGFSIAYLLNPLMMYLERKLKLGRNMVLLLVYFLFIGVMVLISLLLIPMVVKNLIDLINNMNEYITQMQKWITGLLLSNKFMHKSQVSSYFNRNINDILKNANTYLGKGLSILFSNLVNISNIMLKIATGIVISIYLLKDKENLLSNMNRLLVIFIGERNTEKVTGFGGLVNDIFKRFVIGKLIDSVIVGVICYIAMTLMSIPFAPFISIIVGVTNMIPYFGGFIGMAPAILITLFASPIKAIEVTVFLLVLGEVDGLYIGPKIIGEKIGLNPLWIILGITLGGGFFGVVGMFLGVPVMAVLKTLLGNFMKRNLEEDPLQ